VGFFIKITKKKKKKKKKITVIYLDIYNTSRKDG
jgi:hypothetical protein